ncbi:hypothetical protein IV203_015314 [Nitzschia inconspicua]|uniref:Uncharacterized protein n=1 Tax=Nitzschia inconspicua TaxID=303405 RepID=A0A9K3LBH5_9STRA|nr:hypothetical protein IV203_015314 [Nitzschia inconspicua]
MPSNITVSDTSGREDESSTRDVELKSVRSDMFSREDECVNRGDDDEDEGAHRTNQHVKHSFETETSGPALSKKHHYRHSNSSSICSSSSKMDEDIQLPLEIQLALLEDTFFGWTHLTSTFIGHTLWPLFCYWMVYETTRLSFYYLYMQRRTVVESNDTVAATVGWIEIISKALGILAGLGAFRFIRQRRRVWFRSAYGSRAYQQDRAYRRQSVHEADRTNTLGKLMARIQRKRRRRRLQKAKARYAKKHLSRVGESTPRGSGSRGLIFLSRNYASTATTSSPSVAPTTASSATRSEVDKENELQSPTTSKLVNDPPSESSSFSSNDNLLVSYSDEEVTPDSKPRTSSLSTLQQPTSITEDHVAIPLINHVAYAHGGFFGAAPFLLASPQWVRILRKLLPDVYVEISRRVLFSRAPRLIHWAENNPVVAAYGVVQYMKQEQHLSERRQFGDSSLLTPSEDTVFRKTATVDHKMLPTIEWDIFLDPRLVRRVEAVLDSKEKYLRDHINNYNDQEFVSPTEKEREGLLSNPKNKDKVLDYLNSELKKRAQELTDKLLIAHGNTTQLILEQTGYFKDVNYSRIQRTRQSLGGGMYARQWMAVFAEALRLGSKYDYEEDNLSNTRSSSMEDMAWLLNDDDGHDEDDAFSAYLDYSLDTTMSDSLQLIQRITRTQHPMSLLLDLKSRHVPKRVLRVVLETLESAGIDVVGIGSFEISEIRGVTSHCDDGEHNPQDTQKEDRAITKKRAKEILFVHSAGDLKHACHQGIVRTGDHVFFNGGSIIYESSRESMVNSLCKFLFSLGFDGFDPSHIKSGYQLHPCANQHKSRKDENDENTSLSTLRTLHDFKIHYQFSIGIYVQEFSIDEAAARLLVEHVNENPQVYDLGFAWGGVNGMTVQGIQPGRFTSTDGYWNQRHVGKVWS